MYSGFEQSDNALAAVGTFDGRLERVCVALHEDGSHYDWVRVRVHEDRHLCLRGGPGPAPVERVRNRTDIGGRRRPAPEYAVAGRPNDMSAEQARGEFAGVMPGCDVYTCDAHGSGATLLFVRSGGPPVDERNVPSLLGRVLPRSPPDPVRDFETPAAVRAACEPLVAGEGPRPAPDWLGTCRAAVERGIAAEAARG
jgi:hypothetical protein